MLASLARRQMVPELMDYPGLDPAAHREALRGLARLNRLDRPAAAVWPAIAGLARRTPGRPVRVLDVATGSGDLPAAVAARARRAGLAVEADGCDISQTAVAAARARAAGGTFFAHDAVRDPLPGGYDVVTASLFLHHLPDPDVVAVLRRMRAAAGRLVLVSDLLRGRLNYLLVWAACRAVTRSPVVRFDGPASVRAAFTLAEARALAAAAGLTGAAVARRGPCRFLLSWRKT